jgi:HEAT repeat protein
MEKLNSIIKKIRNEESRWDSILELKVYDATDKVDFLIRYLHDKDWIIRWCIAEKLGEVKDPQAIFPLITLLSDNDLHVRKNSAKALVRYGRHAVSLLLEQFQSLDTDVRNSVYEILISMGPRIVPTLIAALDGKSWVIANRIVHLVWTIGGSEAEAELIKSLKYRETQKNAVMMLGKMRSKKAVPVFFRLYSIPSLRRGLVSAINAINYPAYHYLLSKLNSDDQDKAKRAAQICLKIGAQVVPYLIKELKEDKSKRYRIFKVLEKIDQENHKKIVSEFVKKDPEAQRIIKDLEQKVSKKET